jgi:hypothetical protein
MKKIIVLALLFVIMTAWFSCTKDTAIPPPAAPVCDSTHVSYTKSIVPLMNNYCAYSGCHDGNTPGANALTNYIAVKGEMEIDSPNINSILCRSQTSTCGGDIMPKGTRGLNHISGGVYVDTLRLWQAGGYCN